MRGALGFFRCTSQILADCKGGLFFAISSTLIVSEKRDADSELLHRSGSYVKLTETAFSLSENGCQKLTILGLAVPLSEPPSTLLSCQKSTNANHGVSLEHKKMIP